MKIEIITTPNSTLKETGFGALTACNSVMRSLQKAHYSAAISVCLNAENVDAVIARKPDVIIGVVKYIMLENGQKLWLSEYLEDREINFTGSERQILSYDSSKVLAKRKVALQGIRTARFFLVLPFEYSEDQDLPIPYPVFIKPADAANGNGIDSASLAYNFEQFETKVQSLYAEYAEPVLVEEYLEGREFTVAVLEDSQKLVIAAVEIIAPEDDGIRILGAKVKAENTEILRIVSDEAVLCRVTDIAEKSFRALGARDFGRIDIKMDNNGKCYFMEANLVPGMTKGSSYFPEACDIGANLDYDHVVCLMVQGAVGRV